MSYYGQGTCASLPFIYQDMVGEPVVGSCRPDYLRMYRSGGGLWRLWCCYGWVASLYGEWWLSDMIVRRCYCFEALITVRCFCLISLYKSAVHMLPSFGCCKVKCSDAILFVCWWVLSSRSRELQRTLLKNWIITDILATWSSITVIQWCEKARNRSTTVRVYITLCLSRHNCCLLQFSRLIYMFLVWNTPETIWSKWLRYLFG